MNKLQLLIPILLLILIILIPSSEVLAQCIGGPQGDDGCCLLLGACGVGPAGCTSCSDIPLDGGLSALLLAGVAYGYKIIRKS